ncbi:PD-(D/E)XK nuclease family protein [Patescibacteria group bacterium]|nr:PD-(D/E)XK nuclease family protein [Patescibacteria group bacterium]
MDKKPIRLSPSTGLNLFNDCPKCFWMHHNHKFPRPRGIFPSLPGGMDNVIKKYFDKFRKNSGLPPELEGKVKGGLMPDLELMEKWRDWRTGLEYHDKARNAVLFGALDDCLVDDKTHIVLDYKTRGYPPKEGDSQRYYGTQMDAYALMLWANGYKVAPFAYLVYYYPEEVKKNGVVAFNVEPVEIEVSIKRAKELFEKALDCLDGPEPKSHSECIYCSWVARLSEFD